MTQAALSSSRPLKASPPAAPSLAAFEARAATLVSCTEGRRAVAKELGFPHPRALFMACLKSWRAAIEAAPALAAQNDEQRLRAESAAQLRKVSLEVLAAGDMPMRAVSCGWDHVQLFGVHEGSAPEKRGDACGINSNARLFRARPHAERDRRRARRREWREARLGTRASGRTTMRRFWCGRIRSFLNPCTLISKGTKYDR